MPGLYGTLTADSQEERHDSSLPPGLRPLCGNLQRRQEGQRPYRQHSFTGKRQQDCSLHQQAELLLPCNRAEQDTQRKLPLCGCTFRHLQAVRLPERTYSGQVPGHGDSKVGQRPAVPHPVHQRSALTQGGEPGGPGIPHHVHLFCNRGTCHIRQGNHDLHLLSGECKAKATDRRQEGLGLQDLRLHLRGRGAAGRLYLPIVQAWCS